MSSSNFIFAYLPFELKELILEYDPNRRTLLNTLCNELRLGVPYWYRMRGIVQIINYADRNLKNVMDLKVLTCWDISLASSCDFCGEKKSTKSIISYIKNLNQDYYFGMYCNRCIEEDQFL